MFFFIFPGQGSQQPGMGKFLFDNFQTAKYTFDEASDALRINLKELCFNGSEQDLALTENTQPALLVNSVATARVLKKDFGIQCNLAAGHSIGEYAALVTANVLPFSSAAQAVRIRGQAMQSAVPVGQGGMFAIMGLEPEQVETLCQYVVHESKLGPLSAANFNCPGQIVISGSTSALQWLKENVKPEQVWKENAPKRMKLIPLQVSAPFHCQMMMPAENKMREVLNEISFSDADFPVIQNFTAKSETKKEALKENLIRQVSAPVRWMQSMATAKTLSANTAIECGSGKVLQGLLKKIDPEFFQVSTTTSLEDLKIIEELAKG